MLVHRSGGDSDAIGRSTRTLVLVYSQCILYYLQLGQVVQNGT